MFTGAEFVEQLERLAVSDVIWVPDSVIGRWESSLESARTVRLLRVCREGEAWPLAAGLMIGGRFPVVLMQTTGLYESGDALRNVVYDMRLPVFAVIGARNWLNHESEDSATTFAEPILKAWNVDYQVIASGADKGRFGRHYRACRSAGRPGAILLAE